MSNQLRILIVEDLAHDAELMLRELQRAGIRYHANRVETAEEYRRELEAFQPDVILSDFTVPNFDGMEALRIASQSYPHIPFIFVSGTLGEEDAVRALKNGATDYILKNNLLRLPAAVERAKKEAEERHSRRALELQLRESEKRYRELFQSNPHPMWVYDIGTLRFLAVNDTAVARYGFSHEEFLAMTIKDIRPGKDLPRLLDHLEKPLPLVNKPEIWRHRSKSGELVDVEIASHDLVLEGRPARIVVAYDITERIQQQEKIARLSRVLTIRSAINSAIVRTHDRQALFDEACRITVEEGGFTMVLISMVDRSVMKIVPVASAGVDEELMTAIKGLLSSSESASKTMIGQAIREKKIVVSNDSQSDPKALLGKQHGESGVRSLAVLPLLVSDQAVGVLALYASEREFFHEEELKLLTELTSDISFALDHIEKEEKLNYLAYYDVLTGLANRSLFLERAAQCMRSAVSGGHKLAVFILDLERFKNINDSLGRAAGDALLKQVSEFLSRAAGDPSLLAHLGADHFAIVVPELKQEGNIASLLERKMRAFLNHTFRPNDTELRIAIKVGGAIFPDDGADADTLLQNAEAALKKAKASGERYLFYTQRMTATVAGNLTLENQLRQALDNEEFALHYQPKVNLVSGKLTGAEALIRWNDPRTGLVPPGRFIPILEETGLIYEVGRWALHKAIEDYLRWRAAGLAAVRIAVNVSPLQLRNHGFIAEIKQAIGVGAHAAAGLELEITESLIMEDVRHNIASLRAIRAMGISIAIDDFGTGFSSLSYLAKLPVDTLKIDRSFVIDMSTGPDGLALVSTIINLAHSLKLKVVAEGVETEEQSRLLRLLNCDEMQGYLFSKPLPGEIFETRFLAPPLTG